MSDPLPRLASYPDHIVLEWPGGARHEFAACWLADNRAEDRHANGQRLTDVADLPARVAIRAARLRDGRVEVEFEAGLPPFERSLEWLRATRGPITGLRAELRREPWLDGAARDPRRDFAWAGAAGFAADDATRGRWLQRLARDGIAFLRDVPCVPGTIVGTCARMGEVMHTNYGTLFDVRAVPTPENLAYTDLGLGLHTDNPYRDPVPGFQALHTLVAAPDGGDSLFADGIALARHLRATDPAAFDVLAGTPVVFHYRSAEADLCAVRPLIDLDVTGEVRAVHYNSRSIAPLRLEARDAERFYAAYRAFAGLLREPRFQARMRLEAGELVVFDNHRILHGRTGFASQRYPRHLQGCYLTRDSVLSLAAMLGEATP